MQQHGFGGGAGSHSNYPPVPPLPLYAAGLKTDGPLRNDNVRVSDASMNSPHVMSDWLQYLALQQQLQLQTQLTPVNSARGLSGQPLTPVSDFATDDEFSPPLSPMSARFAQGGQSSANNHQLLAMSSIASTQHPTPASSAPQSAVNPLRNLNPMSSLQQYPGMHSSALAGSMMPSGSASARAHSQSPPNTRRTPGPAPFLTFRPPNPTNPALRLSNLPPSHSSTSALSSDLPPSRVIHLKNLPSQLSEGDLLTFCTSYGPVIRLLLLSIKNQALVEFTDLEAAIRLHDAYEASQKKLTPKLRIQGKDVHVEYSAKKEIRPNPRYPLSLRDFSKQQQGASGKPGSGGSPTSETEEKPAMQSDKDLGENKSGGSTPRDGDDTDSVTNRLIDLQLHLHQNEIKDPVLLNSINATLQPNRILLVSILSPTSSLSLPMLYNFFSKFGGVQRIILFQKRSFHALVEYDLETDAIRAKEEGDEKELQSTVIPPNLTPQEREKIRLRNVVRISYSSLQPPLKVRRNDERSRDYTKNFSAQPILVNGVNVTLPAGPAAAAAVAAVAAAAAANKSAQDVKGNLPNLMLAAVKDAQNSSSPATPLTSASHSTNSSSAPSPVPAGTGNTGSAEQQALMNYYAAQWTAIQLAAMQTQNALNLGAMAATNLPSPYYQTPFTQEELNNLTAASNPYPLMLMQNATNSPHSALASVQSNPPINNPINTGFGGINLAATQMSSPFVLSTPPSPLAPANQLYATPSPPMNSGSYSSAFSSLPSPAAGSPLSGSSSSPVSLPLTSSLPSPHHSHSQGRVLLISHLPSLTNVSSLFRLFGVYGDVHRIKMLNKQRTSALIQFASQAGAQAALKNLDQISFYGSAISVTMSKCAEISVGRSSVISKSLNALSSGKDGDNKETAMDRDGGVLAATSNAAAGLSEELDELTRDYTSSPFHRFKSNFANHANPSATLFIEQLPTRMSDAELLTFVSKHFVDLEEKDVAQLHTDARRKCVCVGVAILEGLNAALLRMNSVESAILALMELHNERLRGQVLRVSFSQAKDANSHLRGSPLSPKSESSLAKTSNSSNTSAPQSVNHSSAASPEPAQH